MLHLNFIVRGYRHICTRKWVNGSFQNLCLNYLIICFVFDFFFTEGPDLRSSVITLKMLWFNLILDFHFHFSNCLSYSCDGKFHSQINAVKCFSSTKRGYKCTLVQSESRFNLPYRQSFFFFLLQNNIENSEKSSITWTFGTSLQNLPRLWLM